MPLEPQPPGAARENALPGRAGVSDDAALILDSTPAGVYGLDLEGRATLVNDAAVHIVGWSRADLLGRRLHDVLHHSREDGAAYPVEECPVYRSLKDGQTLRSLPEVYWRKDGTSVAVEIDCHPIVHDGARVGLLVTFRDMTDRRRSEERARELIREQVARVTAERHHAQLRDALAQAPALICLTRGPRHIVESANERYLQTIGRSDLGGRPLADAYPDAPAESLAMLDRAFQTGLPVAAQESPSGLFGQGSSERLFNFVIQPLRDEAGTVYGLILHAVEVTEQVRARHALVTQNRLSRLVADVGLILSRGGELHPLLQQCASAVVEYVDAAVARIWTLDDASQLLELQASAGLEPQADTGGSASRPGSEVPLERSAIGRIAQQRVAHCTNTLPDDPDLGGQAWLAREGVVAFAGYPLLVADRVVGVLSVFARRPLGDAELQAIGAVASGLSIAISRKRDEEALKESEQRLRRRAAELTRVALALERSNRELDAFAYAASHDLRAPLRGIANLAQWIEEDMQGTLSQDTREMLGLMRSRMHRMESLIEGLLEYSRAGRAHQETELVDTARLVREAIDLLAPSEDATIEVASDLPAVTSERLPLQQVFMNLIGNALKHAARRDPHVTVSARDDGEFVEFSVADNGPGIDAQFHDRIWGIFQTLEARDKVEGTGIGLALVKKLVEAQGGRVQVESSPGAGATFRFLWRKSPTREE